jgi:hypothetical protein
MWLNRLLRTWSGGSPFSRPAARRRRARPGVEPLEGRCVPARLAVTSALDPAILTAGTLRYAVSQANADAAQGNSDSITFDTARMGTSTITLQQGRLELGAGSGTTTIDGGGRVTIGGAGASGDFLIDSGANVSMIGLAIQGGRATVGGGIENLGALALSNATLSGNVGLWNGGAIFNGIGATLAVSNVTLAGNAAAGYGGGIDSVGSLTVTDSTVAGNTAQYGGGMADAAPTTLVNCLVAGNKNTTGGAGPDVYGGLSFGSAFDLIGNGSGMTGITSPGAVHDQIGTAYFPIAPLLAPLGYYGGSLPTMALLANSPAIGGGEAIAGLTTDERGLPRTGAADIGAYQAQPLATLAVSATATVTAGTPFSITITAQDQYGNPVTNGNVTVTLATSDGQAVTPATITLVNGTATLNLTLKTADALMLTATAGDVTGSSGNITVSPAAAASLTVSTSSAAVAGSGFITVVMAWDAYGNLATGYNGTATLASDDGQTVVPGSLPLHNGYGAAIVTLDVAHRVTLTATSGALRGVGNGITINPGPASTFAVSAPAAVTAGTSFNVAISAQDKYGNTATSHSGPVTLACSDHQTVAVAPPGVTLVNGTANVAVTLNNADTVTLTVVAGTLQGVSKSIVVNPPPTLGDLTSPKQPTANQPFTGTLAVAGGTGGYSNLSVTGLPAGLGARLSANTVAISGSPPTAGTFNFVVAVQDALGAKVSRAFAITIAPASSLTLSPGTLPAEIAGQNYGVPFGATGGYGRYIYTLTAGTSLPPGLTLDSTTGLLSGATTKAGSYNFTVVATDASLGTLTGSEACTLTVSPAAISVVVSVPGSVRAGTSFTVSITARDQYGNGYAGPVSLASSDGKFATSNVPMTEGVASTTVTLTAAHAVTFRATAGAASGVSNNITITPASISQVSFSTQPPPSVIVGQVFGAAVQVEDRYNNPIPSVTVTIGSTAVSTNAQGIATFNNLSEAVPGTYTLRASVAGGPSATSQPLTASWPTYTWTASTTFVYVSSTTNLAVAIGGLETVSGSLQAPSVSAALSLIPGIADSMLFDKARNDLKTTTLGKGLPGILRIHDQFSLGISDSSGHVSYQHWLTFLESTESAGLGLFAAITGELPEPVA